MAVLYEHYNTGDDAYTTIAGNRWGAQTFTPSIEHTIISVKLKVSRWGNPYNFWVSIRETLAGNPTGEDLCVKSIASTTIALIPEWKELAFSPGYPLAAGTQYAIVARCDRVGGTVSNYVNWHAKDPLATYDGGTWVLSGNAGAEWAIDTDKDAMFEEYGPDPPPPPTNPYIDRTIELTGTLPESVWVLPVVNDLDNVIVHLGSSDSPIPDLTSTSRYVQINGRYLRIKVEFSALDLLRSLRIFKVF